MFDIFVFNTIIHFWSNV